MRSRTAFGEHPVAYMSPARPSFWRWDTDGSVTWFHGSTLCFREELTMLVRHLQPHGLPPLEALLLLLAALREAGSPGGLEEAWEAHVTLYPPKILEKHLPEGWRHRVRSTLLGLKVLGPVWRRELTRKCLVAEVCFEASREKLSPRQSQGVLDLCETGFLPPEPLSEDGEQAVIRLAWGLRPLLEGFPVLEEERLALRLRTGLDAMPATGEQGRGILPAEVRTWMKTVEGDEDWSGFVRLTERLRAAVRMPERLGTPEDLRIGGYSDISNRGSIDRLLLSELAQDEDVFAAKLALNEALYLRRESMPSRRARTLYVLWDNGLRLWGLPRIFAAAVTMALGLRLGEDTRMRIYLPGPAGVLRELPGFRREDVEEALSGLGEHLHPGNLLVNLMALVRRAEVPGDVYLVTHAEVWEDPEFAAMAALTEDPFYLATVDRRGAYAFYRCDGDRRRMLFGSRLSLEVLRGQSSGTGEERRDEEVLPAIFGLHPFPLRLPYGVSGGQVKHLFWGENPVFKVRDGRLLLFDQERRGGWEISDTLPAGRLLEAEWAPCDFREKGWRVVALLDRRRLHVRRVQPNWGKEEGVEIAVKAAPLRVMAFDEVILVLFRRSFALYDWVGGSQVSEMGPLPGELVDLRDGLLATTTGWYGVSYDGFRLHMEAAKEEPMTDREKAREDLVRRRLRIPPGVGGIRKRFRAVGRRGSALVLQVEGSLEALAVVYHPAKEELRWGACDDEPEAWTRLRTVRLPGGSRVPWREARWADGSRVCLDGRGLLHLMSGSREIPEITLVLSDPRLAAWLGGAGGAGDSYFFHEEARVSMGEVQRHLQAFVEALPE